MEMPLLEINEPGNRLETQKCIVTTARELLSADWCAIITLNPINQQFYEPCGMTSKLQDRDIELFETWLKRTALKLISGGQEYVTDLFTPPDILLDDFNLTETGSVRAITLYTKQRQDPLAVLYLGFRQSRQLAPTEESALKALVSQASSALESVWLLGRYRSVVRIGQKLNLRLGGPRELFEKLNEEVASIIDTSYFFMLAVYQPQSNKLDRYFSLMNGESVVELGMHLEGVSEIVIKNARSLTSFHLSSNEDWNVNHVDLLGKADPAPESVIFEPLIFHGEVLGVLTVQHSQPYAFDDEDLRIMKLLGNQVALALSNLRLFRYVQTLNEVGQRLTVNLSSENLLKEIADEVRQATYADIIALYPYLLADNCFGQPIYSGSLREPDALRPTVRLDNIAWLTLRQGAPVWARDSSKLYEALGGDIEYREGNFEVREGIVSTAAVGLQIGNEAIGVMFANFRVPQSFHASQRNLILGLANYAAIAIKNYRKYTAANQRRFEDLLTLQKIERQMRQTPGLKEILHAILEGAVSRIPVADESSIFLYNPRTEQLEAAASLGNNVKVHTGLALPITDGRGSPAWVYRNKSPMRVDNVKTAPEFRDIFYPVTSDTVSELACPLIDEDDVIGVISFESKMEGAFTKEDEEFISTLAGQAVLAIRNAQLYETAEAARQELDTLHDVAQKITLLRSDPEEVMKFILQKARVLLGAEMGALQLYEGIRPGKTFISEAYTKDGDPIIQTIEPGNTEHRGILGIVQYVAETRLPYITQGDAMADPYYHSSRDYHSEIAVPLLSRTNELIGVLDLESPRHYAFDEADLKVLETFARQAVIAIQYAQAYSLARAESARFQLLAEAGRDLSELTELIQIDQAYDITLQKVLRFTDAEVILRRFDEKNQELVLERVLNPLHAPIVEKISISGGINGQVAQERRTVVLHDLDNLPNSVTEPGRDSSTVRTLAITPIQFKTRYYGNLTLSREEAYSFSRADVLLLEGLAQQLAITIYRLEIVKEKHMAEEQAKNLELVAELGQSTLEIAHRLGNDLGLVRFYINNIRGALSSSGIESPAINEELDKLARDVGNVLRMSKGLKQKVVEIGEEGIKQERTTIPIKALLEDSSWTLPLAENINIHWDIADDLAQVNVFPGQIVDILRNLLANAIEAMPDGGSIIIRAFNAPPYVQIEIEDTGPGIPLLYQPKIFNLFFSTKSSSGFGLWSARRYARANGGELTLESKLGKGSTFILRLPTTRESLDAK